jgi:alpha-L-arabinofuranosidase
VLLAKSVGGIALDEISLFPRNTFHNRPNGLRADLAQVIADLHPKFVRFPGGCLAHGDGIQNFYRWKDTIGPIEQRRGQKNIWRYHQSVGLGYFEYFQFCEDIGAKPLPILPAAVSCQNSDHSSGLGQQCVSIEDMPAYIQDVLDLIEWANGPATSKWGAKRAEAGHPEPFHLQYLGIGNEDKITSGFKERFKMIYDAVKAKHPEITVVGTVGPAPDGEDFNLGWKFADDLHVPIVDEHYYKPPEWFFANRNRYDAYDRAKPHVYVGEYAAHDIGKHVTFRSALAEAAYMTSLERNGDVVRMSSFAPLLARHGHTQWNPDLIYFTGTTIAPTISYYVQQMFCSNAGDTWLPTTVSDPALAVSTVRDSISGDLILKIVNPDAAPKPLQVALSGAKKLAPTATKTVLAETNPPQPIGPQVSTLVVGPAFNYEAPPNSLTVIRMKSQSR